jgi:tmRNA-binding protein
MNNFTETLIGTEKYGGNQIFLSEEHFCKYSISCIYLIDFNGLLQLLLHMVEITKIKVELETDHDEINILMILTLLALLLPASTIFGRD